MLAARVARLPEDARRLLEVIAVGGRPLPVATVGRRRRGRRPRPSSSRPCARAASSARACARASRSSRRATSASARRSSRSSRRRSRARHHRRLARVLEATPDADPEAIASHLLGAGDKQRAAVYAERAAEQAVAKLAFAQAARLFELTLETIGPSSPEARRLARRTAEACEWAGYAEKAARAYLRAAEGAPALERVDLERLAAAQLIAAGRIDESAEVSRRVLAAVGRKVPDSVLGTIFGDHRLPRLSRCSCSRNKLDDGESSRPKTTSGSRRCTRSGRGLAVVDPISANYVKARNLVDALRSGSRAQVVRAAVAEASSLASRGGSRGKRERALWDMVRSLSANGRDPAGFAVYQVTYGVCLYLRGEWRASRDMLDEACARLEAVRRWQANANVFAVYAIAYMGDLREVKLRTTRLLADAEQARRPVHGGEPAREPPDGGVARVRRRRGARGVTSASRWSSGRRRAFWSSTGRACSGRARSSSMRATARAPGTGSRATRGPLRRSHLLSVQLMRALTHFVRGRGAPSRRSTSLGGAARDRRLAEAVRAHRALAKEAMPWTAVLATHARRGHREGRGRRSRRRELRLRESIERATALEMSLHAGAARHQLGCAARRRGRRRDGARGGRGDEDAGVRVPERYAGMLLPGPWSRRPADRRAIVRGHAGGAIPARDGAAPGEARSLMGWALHAAPPRSHRRHLDLALVLLAFLLCAAPARAAPWIDAGEDAIEERIADGDLDEEDRAPCGSTGAPAARPTCTARAG